MTYEALFVVGNNALAAVGKTKGSYEQISLSSNTNLTSGEFKDLIIREDGDRIIRLSDVADVILGAEDYDADVRFGEEDESCVHGCLGNANANSLDITNRVEKRINAMQSRFFHRFTGGIAYTLLMPSIPRWKMVTTLMETLGIVVAMLFLFLGSVRLVLASRS